MQEMNSEIEEETTKRLSSVVSSEASSQISVSSGSNYEIQSSTSKKKSSSLSCLPDRISGFDCNTSTLPPNLNSVRLFEENLHPKGGQSTRSWVETTRFLEEQFSEDEMSSNDDQRSTVDSVNNVSVRRIYLFSYIVNEGNASEVVLFVGFVSNLS